MLYDRRGTAALEFALILPVLLALTFGILDLGRLLYTQTALDYVAQDMARCRAIGAPSCPPRGFPGLEAATYTVIEGPMCLKIEGEVPFFSILFPARMLHAKACYPI